MAIYPDDIVYCRVRGNTIVSLSEKWDAEIPFVIVGISRDNFYILVVPKYYNIRHSWKIDKSHANDCNIDSKHIGHKALAVPLWKISKIIRKTPVEQDGMVCHKCKKFHHMAEGNQDDDSFLCYSCKSRGY